MNRIRQVYDILLNEYGQMGWWPKINDKTLHCEYHVGCPKNEQEALEVAFSAILAQNTQWNPNAVRAMQQLKLRKLFDPRKIIKIENKELSAIIKPSGYHNQKAIKLKNFCSFLLERHGGSIAALFNQDILNLRKELLSVKGIGPETADSIILYAGKKPIFVVDSYTKRILRRIGFKAKDYSEIQELFMDCLPNSEKLFNEYHALLVELGKKACRKIPLCGTCPINTMCYYYNKMDKN